MKSIAILLFLVFAIQGCSSGGSKGSDGQKPGSSSSSSANSSSSLPTSARVTEVILELTEPLSVTEESLEQLGGKLADMVGVGQLSSLFGTLRDDGLNNYELNNIIKAVQKSGTALGIVFANDLASGQLNLSESNVINIEKDVVKGKLGKDNIFNYKIAQDVNVNNWSDGISSVLVEMDISFSFPAKNALFGIGDGYKDVHLNEMEVIVHKLKVTSGTVSAWVVASDEPAMTISLAAFIEEASGGGTIGVTVLQEDGLNVLSADLHVKIEDTNSSTAATADITGIISAIEANIDLRKTAKEDSELNLTPLDFKIEVKQVK